MTYAIAREIVTEIAIETVKIIILPISRALCERIVRWRRRQARFAVPRGKPVFPFLVPFAQKTAAKARPCCRRSSIEGDEDERRYRSALPRFGGGAPASFRRRNASGHLQR